MSELHVACLMPFHPASGLALGIKASIIAHARLKVGEHEALEQHPAMHPIQRNDSDV
jgi:hypothetical protein